MKRGDIYHDGKYPWLITDVAKKNKEDDIQLYDDEWNEAKVGEKFVYAVNVNANCTTQGRERYETFIQRFKFLAKVPMCSCHNCSQYHPRWNLYYSKIKALTTQNNN